MNRYQSGLLAIVIATSGMVYFLGTRPPDQTAARPAPIPRELEKPAASPAPPIVGDAPPSSSLHTEALLQAPDEALPVKIPSAPAIPAGAQTPPDGTGRHARILIPVGEPVPELFPFQTEREQISKLASTYDEEKIPAIAAYLTHRDASVREAARQGLVQVSDAKAIPYLEKAAAKAPTPEEAALLAEAAEFLALPTFVDIVLPTNKKPQS